MTAINSPNLPKDLVKGVFGRVKTLSAFGTLLNAEPQGIADKEHVTLTSKPKAEIVGHGQAKSNSGGSLGSVSTKTHKAQVTMRFDDEVLVADKEYQIGILKEFGDAIAEAVARQIDLMAIHGVSALAGTVVPSQVNFASQTVKSVDFTTSADAALLASIGSLVNTGSAPNFAAFDPAFAFALATEANGTLNPGVAFGESAFSVKGLNAVATTTVSGIEELSADSGIRGIVSHSGNAVYGLNEFISLELIEYGDPDGGGDLKRKNQVALRTEVRFAAGWIDLNRVSKIVADVPETEGTTED